MQSTVASLFMGEVVFFGGWLGNQKASRDHSLAQN
jgi:hypothetical protein